LEKLIFIIKHALKTIFWKKEPFLEKEVVSAFLKKETILLSERGNRFYVSAFLRFCVSGRECCFCLYRKK
jgi:hypothetical protein